MPTPALTLRAIPHGWAIILTSGTELARYHGPLAHFRALRHIDSISGASSARSFPRRI
jgi:hypothetical protein